MFFWDKIDLVAGQPVVAVLDSEEPVAGQHQVYLVAVMWFLGVVLPGREPQDPGCHAGAVKERVKIRVAACLGKAIRQAVFVLHWATTVYISGTGSEAMKDLPTGWTLACSGLWCI